MNEFVCKYEENLSCAILSTKNPTWTILKTEPGTLQCEAGN